MKQISYSPHHFLRFNHPARCLAVFPVFPQLSRCRRGSDTLQAERQQKVFIENVTRRGVKPGFMRGLQVIILAVDQFDRHALGGQQFGNTYGKLMNANQEEAVARGDYNTLFIQCKFRSRDSSYLLFVLFCTDSRDKIKVVPWKG